MTVRIRTKMRPWEEIEVDPVEAEDLRRMGALVEDDSAPSSRPGPHPRPTPSS